MTSDINPTMRASVDSGGDQTVSSGMIVSRGVFLSNTSQTMLFGGVADFAVVSSGLQDVFGVANGTLVTGGGTLPFAFAQGEIIIEAGGVALGVTVTTPRLKSTQAGRRTP